MKFSLKKTLNYRIKEKRCIAQNKMGKWETELSILGLKPGKEITKEIVKKKYKKKILMYHPDKGREKNANKFIKIKNAYDYIINILENDKTEKKIINTIITSEEFQKFEITIETNNNEIIYKIRNKENNKEIKKTHKELINIGQSMYKREKLPIRFIKKRAIEQIIKDKFYKTTKINQNRQ